MERNISLVIEAYRTVEKMKPVELETPELEKKLLVSKDDSAI